MEEIEVSLANQDRTTLKRAAHSLKNSNDNLAAAAATAAAFHLESNALQGEMLLLQNAWTDLQREVQRLIPVVTALVNDSKKNNVRAVRS